MRQITRISPCVLTGEYDTQNNPLYGYNEEIIVGADALRYRNGIADLSCLMGLNTKAGEGAVIGQVIIGQYNKVMYDPVFIIGNGSSETDRSNIVEVTNSTFLIKRDLNVEGTSILSSLTVNNTATLNNGLIVNGNTDIEGILETTDIKVNNNLTVAKNTTLSGNLTVKGTIKNDQGVAYVMATTLNDYYTATAIDNKFLTKNDWGSKVTGSSNWNWSGQSGQPTWLWGGNNINDFYIYNPSNFSVAYANKSNYAQEINTNDIRIFYNESGNELKLQGKNHNVTLAPGSGWSVFMERVYSNNFEGGRTLRIDSDGEVHTNTSSSARFKHSIEDVKDKTLEPQLLYKIPIKQYYYKNKKVKGLKIGLIAEDVAEIYPVAAIYDQEGPENWDERYIIPPMLKLIQDQHKAIEELKEEIQKIKGNS